MAALPSLQPYPYPCSLNSPIPFSSPFRTHAFREMKKEEEMITGQEKEEGGMMIEEEGMITDQEKEERKMITGKRIEKEARILMEEGEMKTDRIREEDM